MFDELDFDRFILKWGRPAPIWLGEMRRIGGLIKEWGLEALSPECYPWEGLEMPMEEMAGEGAVSEYPILRKIVFPGGLKVAHFHYADKIFLLDEEQWQKFSQPIIQGFQERLGSAQTVNVQQLTQLSDVVAGF